MAISDLALKKRDISALLLRMGLGFVFAYAAISSLLYPNDWIGYLPKFLTSIVDGDLLLKLMSVYELVLVIWLLSGWKTKYAAVLSALTLGGIALANLSLLPISFRDIGLVFGALALASLDRDDNKP
jgi:uncharacterized membrane protein YphA (DoxX/SURF4 family)